MEEPVPKFQKIPYTNKNLAKDSQNPNLNLRFLSPNIASLLNLDLLTKNSMKIDFSRVAFSADQVLILNKIPKLLSAEQIFEKIEENGQCRIKYLRLIQNTSASKNASGKKVVGKKGKKQTTKSISELHQSALVYFSNSQSAEKIYKNGIDNWSCEKYQEKHQKLDLHFMSIDRQSLNIYSKNQSQTINNNYNRTLTSNQISTHFHEKLDFLILFKLAKILKKTEDDEDTQFVIEILLEGLRSDWQKLELVENLEQGGIGDEIVKRLDEILFDVGEDGNEKPSKNYELLRAAFKNRSSGIYLDQNLIEEITSSRINFIRFNMFHFYDE